MILVDTSVWIEHFRKGSRRLEQLLDDGHVLAHPFVIGELACGNLSARQQILDLLQQLPQAPLASQDEALQYIERHSLMGRGIGFIDAHLLAATALAGDARLWTRDRCLSLLASEQALAYA